MKNYFEIDMRFLPIYTYLGNNYIHECHMTCKTMTCSYIQVCTCIQSVIKQTSLVYSLIFLESIATQNTYNYVTIPIYRYHYINKTILRYKE